MRRRDYLRYLSASAFAALLPPVWARPPSAPPGTAPSTSITAAQRVLVLIELQGGNDGLNTLIPYSDPEYFRLRPRLAIAPERVLRLDQRFGLHPALAPLLPAWEARQWAWVQGVGYGPPNRSHFRSIEIWETATVDDPHRTQGWLAELFDRHPPAADLVAAGIVFDEDLGPLAGGRAPVVAVRHPRQLLRSGRAAPSSRVVTPNPALQHVLDVQSQVQRTGRRLRQRLGRDLDRQQATATGPEFPAHAFGRQLHMAYQLLVRRVPVAVIKVGLGSFDTHANQLATHQRLLTQLAEGLAVFRRGLQDAGVWDRVLIMSYSEFGRRAAENGSAGTDHGTAAPHFLLGGAVRGGLYGHAPGLRDLVQGDLRYQVDFRSLYHTVARHWWSLPRAGGLAKYPALDCLSS